MIEPQPGTYRHYKGKDYTVIGVAQHTETGEELVIYRDADQCLWVRPRTMFLETVEVDGQQVPRFMRIQEPEPIHFRSKSGRMKR